MSQYNHINVNKYVNMQEDYLKKTLMIQLYLLLHLHVLEDGVHPPGLGKHGAESRGVADNEDPCTNLKTKHTHTQKHTHKHTQT